MRRRFRIVGKQFEPAALKQAIQDFDSSESPDVLKPHLNALFSLVQDCLDQEGKFSRRLKSDGMWHLAHLLERDVAEYREKIDKLHDALDLLLDQCPDEWYDSEEGD